MHNYILLFMLRSSSKWCWDCMRIAWHVRMGSHSSGIKFSICTPTWYPHYKVQTPKHHFSWQNWHFWSLLYWNLQCMVSSLLAFLGTVRGCVNAFIQPDQDGLLPILTFVITQQSRCRQLFWKSAHAAWKSQHWKISTVRWFSSVHHDIMPFL